MTALGFEDDLRACLAIRDERAWQNAEARSRCLRDDALRDLLLVDALRRGQRAIDWADYFRNAEINYP